MSFKICSSENGCRMLRVNNRSEFRKVLDRDKNERKKRVGIDFIRKRKMVYRLLRGKSSPERSLSTEIFGKRIRSLYPPVRRKKR